MIPRNKHFSLGVLSHMSCLASAGPSSHACQKFLLSLLRTQVLAGGFSRERGGSGSPYPPPPSRLRLGALSRGAKPAAAPLTGGDLFQMPPPPLAVARRYEQRCNHANASAPGARGRSFLLDTQRRIGHETRGCGKHYFGQSSSLSPVSSHNLCSPPPQPLDP